MSLGFSFRSHLFENSLMLTPFSPVSSCSEFGTVTVGMSLDSPRYGKTAFQAQLKEIGIPALLVFSGSFADCEDRSVYSPILHILTSFMFFPRVGASDVRTFIPSVFALR